MDPGGYTAVNVPFLLAQTTVAAAQAAEGVPIPATIAGVIGLLSSAVIAFYTGKVMSGKAHEAELDRCLQANKLEVERIIASSTKEIERLSQQYEARLLQAAQYSNELIVLARRNVGIAEAATSIASKTTDKLVAGQG